MNDRNTTHRGGVDVAGYRQDKLTPSDRAESGSPDASRQADRLIRTPAEIHAAAAAIPRTVAPWRGEFGPRWQITISGGSVQLGSKDFGRIAASAEERRQLELSDDLVMDDTITSKGKRGAITGLSSKARTRMVKTLCAIDYSKIAGDGCTPGLVTLTLPHDWETVAPTPAAFKKIVNKFRARYEKAWGHAMPGIWKLEFQMRQQCQANGCHDPRAPHLHILTDVPQGAAPRPISATDSSHLGRCARDACAHDAHFREDMDFKRWLSHTWALCVAHPDPDEFAKHLGAGTNVSYEETLRYADSKRIAVYFTKHGTFQNKAYQDDFPELWKAALVDDPKASGTLWGYWVVPVVRAVQETSESLIMHIMSDQRSRATRSVRPACEAREGPEAFRANCALGFRLPRAVWRI